MRLTITIPGIPQPQGSKRLVGVKGRAPRMIEDNPKLRPWRADAITHIQAALGAGHVPVTGAVGVLATYRFQRPNSHYRTGRFVDLLKEAAPAHHVQKPDRDKLDRAVHDALTQAGFWRDDAQSFTGTSSKEWTDGPPSTEITLLWSDQ